MELTIQSLGFQEDIKIPRPHGTINHTIIRISFRVSRIYQDHHHHHHHHHHHRRRRPPPPHHHHHHHHHHPHPHPHPHPHRHHRHQNNENSKMNNPKGVVGCLQVNETK